MRLRGLCLKHIIFHILYIIVARLCPAFLKHADFYKADRSEKTKTIKPIINEAFVASSEDIMTDYNDLYCLFMRKNYLCIHL